MQHLISDFIKVQHFYGISRKFVRDKEITHNCQVYTHKSFIEEKPARRRI